MLHKAAVAARGKGHADANNGRGAVRSQQARSYRFSAEWKPSFFVGKVEIHPSQRGQQQFQRTERPVMSDKTVLAVILANTEKQEKSIQCTHFHGRKHLHAEVTAIIHRPPPCRGNCGFALRPATGRSRGALIGHICSWPACQSLLSRIPVTSRNACVFASHRRWGHRCRTLLIGEYLLLSFRVDR